MTVDMHTLLLLRNPDNELSGASIRGAILTGYSGPLSFSVLYSLSLSLPYPSFFSLSPGRR